MMWVFLGSFLILLSVFLGLGKPVSPHREKIALFAGLSGAVLFIVAPERPTASATTAIGNARAAYGDGQYQEAANLLHRAAGEKVVSPGLFHDIGNSEFKIGNVGPAILAWERAHSLDPWNRNTTANLRFARGQAALLPPTLSWNEVYSSWLPANAWLWTAAICLWGGLSCLVLPPLLARRRTAWTQAGAVVALSAFILTVPALAGVGSRAQLGVVTVAEAPLRLSPTQEGEVLGKLPAGDIARVELKRGNYIYVRGEGDRAGWVNNDEFTRIWAR